MIGAAHSSPVRTRPVGATALPNLIEEPVLDGCLNCGSELRGPFCGACGQRAVPAYPSVREMIGDAWEELSGYDGRFARTLRLLLSRPGALTIAVLEGRRVRYISRVRLYFWRAFCIFCAPSRFRTSGWRRPPSRPVPR